MDRFKIDLELEFAPLSNSIPLKGKYWIHPETGLYYYNFEAAMSLENEEYRLPKKEDFQILSSNFSSEEMIDNGFGLHGNYYDLDQSFNCTGAAGYFWSSSSSDDSNAWNLNLSSDFRKAYMYINFRTLGFSVRLLKKTVNTFCTTNT